MRFFYSLPLHNKWNASSFAFIFFTALILLVFPVSRASAAITFDSSSSVAVVTPTARASTSITVGGSGSNEMLIIESVFGNSIPTGQTVSVSGTSLFASATQLMVATASNRYASIFYYPNLAPGTYTVSSSWTTNTQGALIAASYFGVNQINSVDATSTANGTSVSPSTYATTTAINDLMINGLIKNTAATTTALGGVQISLAQDQGGASYTGDASWYTQSATGTATSSYTISSSHTWLMVQAAFEPAVPGPPTAPSGFTVSSSTTSTLSLSWTASIPEGAAISFYAIYRGTTSSTISGTPVATTSALSYLDTGLAISTSYYYYLTAQDAVGNVSASSSVASGTTQSAATTSTPPYSLTATAGNAQASLSWQAPTSTGGSNLTEYDIYDRTPSGSGAFGFVASTTPSVTSTIISPLTNGQSFGSTGDDVWALQVFLLTNNILSPTGPAGSKLVNPTSYFGTLTKNALAEYQGKAGVSPANGILGSKTHAYLASIMTWISGTSPLSAQTSQPAPSTPAPSATTPIPAPAPAPTPTVSSLSIGSTGSGVTKLQNILVRDGYLSSGTFTSGTFDIPTEWAVQIFQCLEKIACSGPNYGIVGPATKTALGM